MRRSPATGEGGLLRAAVGQHDVAHGHLQGGVDVLDASPRRPRSGATGAAAARSAPGTAWWPRARVLLGSKTSASRPAPKSGRITRSPGEVNSTCSIRSRMWSTLVRRRRCGRCRRSGRGSRALASHLAPVRWRARASAPTAAASACRSERRSTGRSSIATGDTASQHARRRPRSTAP